jgi:hypothetical protein
MAGFDAMNQIGYEAASGSDATVRTPMPTLADEVQTADVAPIIDCVQKR